MVASCGALRAYSNSMGWPENSDGIVPRLPLTQTFHIDKHDDGGLISDLDAYDKRRAIDAGDDPEQEGFVGWSTTKAQMYAVPQREDFGEFIRMQGFKLV